METPGNFLCPESRFIQGLVQTTLQLTANKSVMEPVYKREKAANYSMEENMVLYNLYKQNYHSYHSKQENGGRKEGTRMRDILLYEWCQILSSLGVARREPSKVAEKIKKDFQTARYMINNYRQRLMNGPSGELIHPRATHPHLVPLFDILEGVESQQQQAQQQQQQNTSPMIFDDKKDVKRFDILTAEMPKPQPNGHMVIPNIIDASPRQEITIPRGFHPPPLKTNGCSFTKATTISAAMSPDQKAAIEEINLEIIKMKKQKIALEIDLIRKQIEFQDSVNRREFGTQPSSSNSSANSLPVAVPPTADFSALFRAFPSAKDPFGFS